MKLFKKIGLFAIILLTCLGVSAQTFYVRQGGSGNGSDWNNAYNSLPATLVRGATYYIANGSYPAYTFQTPANGSLTITIKKATGQDKGTLVGWSDSFTNQANWAGPLVFLTSYYVFDGQLRNESNWGDGNSYGFKINNNSEQQIRMSVGGVAVSHIQIKNTYLLAKNTGLSTTVTGRRYGLDIDTFGGTGTSIGLVISKCFFQYGNVPIFTHNNDGMIVEYSYFDSNESNGANHGEAMSAYYSNHRFIIRHNQFRRITGTAIIAFTTANATIPCDGFQIYGNVIWEASVGDGAFGFDSSTYKFTNTKIYNNTIANKAGAYNQGVAINVGSNNQVYNNLWINCPGTWNGSGVILSNNIINGSASFANAALGDFRLLAKTAIQGVSLSSEYNVDMDNKIRGSDGFADIGAYEFGGAVSTNIIMPTNYSCPTVVITSPVNNSVVLGPTNITVNASSSDTNGIAKVDFYVNSFLANTDISTPYSYNSLYDIGTYMLTAVAQNTRGLTSTSSPIRITVTNTLPVIQPTNTIYIYITNTLYFTNTITKTVTNTLNYTNTVFIDKWFTNTITKTNIINNYYTNTINEVVTNTIVNTVTNTFIPDILNVSSLLNKTNKTLDIKVNFQ